MPHTATILTSSQLHSSPVQPHHLTLSPAALQIHNTQLDGAMTGEEVIEKGLLDGAMLRGGGMEQGLFARQSSLSELTSPFDVQESQELLSEASKISDDLPLR